MKLKLLVITLLTFVMGFAQEKGTVTGKVTDKDLGGEALPFATVTVKGYPNTANTDENGVYTLKVNAGTYTIVFAFLGYESKEVKVTVAAGETKTVDQQLGSTSVQLQDVVIEKTVNREKETALLLEQKNAVEIKQSIGAQELSRKGIGDVEEGLTKITGITKVDSRGIFVRGLEDRYNSLLVNDLAVPSNNPFKKVLPLDIFPTDIVGVVDVFKTFNPNIYADFAGGTFNIATSKGNKDVTKVSVGVGYTTNNNLADFKLDSDAHGAQGFFGLAGSDRQLPGIFGGRPSAKTLTPAQSKSAFPSGFNVDSYKSPLNSSIGFLHSSKFDFKNDAKLTYLVSLNFDNSYTIRKGADRNLFGGPNTGVYFYNDFYASEYKYKTNGSALIGAAYKTKRLDLGANVFYLKNTENSIKDQYGILEAQTINPNYMLRTNQLDQSDYVTAQLTGKYFVTEDKNQYVRGGASFSSTSYQQPDRKFFGGTYDPATNQLIGSYGGNNFLRQYLDIKSNMYYSGMAEYNLKFGKGEDKQNLLTVGYNGFGSDMETSYRFAATFRTDGAPAYYTSNIDNIDSQYNTDLDQANFYYRETSNAQYKSKLFESINAGYANVLFKFNDKWEINGGIRTEQVNRETKYRENGSFNDPYIKKTFNKSYILPSLNAKYGLNDNSNLRLALSKTYTKPVQMEMLAITYINADGTSVSGNPYLVNSDNYNADLKYEWFPSKSETFSVGAFGKKINNAIERTYQPNAGGPITTFFNTGDATLYGVEADFIMELSRFSESLKKFTWGFNTSVMNTNVKTKDQYVNSNGGVSPSIETHKERQLQGASKWLINSDLKYQFNLKENWTNTATLVYSVFGKRIYSVGSLPMDHIYEMPVSRLDLVWSSQVNEHFDFKVSADNLLNPKVRFEEGKNVAATYFADSYVLKEFRRGVGFSVGVNYTF